MSSSIKRFWWLWTITFILIATLLGWQWIDASYRSSKPGFLFFLDRHWASFKQSLQNSASVNKLAGQKPRSIFSKIQILELKYSNRYEFWFDESTKKELLETFKQYPGLILANLDPIQLSKDPILTHLKELKNFVRPMRVENETIGSVELEDYIARDFSDYKRPVYGARVTVKPDDRSYYDSSFNFGYTAFSTDIHSHFVFEYPLTLTGMFAPLPSAPLAAFSQLKNCKQWSFKIEGNLQCLNQSYQMPNPLPLFFYHNSARLIHSPKEVSLRDGILILDIIDSSTSLSTYTSERSTWGQLIATALSNLIQKDFPWTNEWVQFIKYFLFFVFSIWLVYSSLKQKLKTSLTVFAVSFPIFIALDLIATIGFNIKTDPVEFFAAYMILGATAIATRAIIDFEERGLVERALSGYVSEDRLKRILSGSESLKLSGRKAYLTTLLIDIARFSKIAHQLPPEDVFVFVQKFFAIIDPIIFKHGGTIDKKTGDGLLAFFGDNSQEKKDAALSAARAALEMQRTLEALPDHYFNLGDELKAHMRIGINSGEMIIGNAGSEKHFNYTVLGEVVNFTQRLEAACPEGSALVGEETSRLINDDFTLEPKEIRVKNEEQSFLAYRIISEKGRIRT